jgi:hypothetical protein
MKIIYNPFFAERPFLGKQRLFNQVVLNTRGLLAELELRAGLTAVFPSPTELFGPLPFKSPKIK